MVAQLLRFGVVTDCQYADIPTPAKSKREYRQSPAKLREAVAALNTMGDLDFTIHLGDMVDESFSSFGAVMPIFRELAMPRFQCLGNHDYSVEDSEKGQVLAALDMKTPFYSWRVKGWRLIVVDGNDVSLFAKPKGHPRTVLSARIQTSQIPKPASYNGGLGATQLSWLRHQLDQAVALDEPVILFGHYPVLPADSHTLWNAGEVAHLLGEYHSTVRAVLCGHNHEGNYAAQHGIHFLNFRGMVDTKTNAFARVEAQSTGLKVIGYGREPNRSLPWPAVDYTPRPPVLK